MGRPLLASWGPALVLAGLALYVAVGLRLSAYRTQERAFGWLGRHRIVALTVFIAGTLGFLAGQAWFWYWARDDQRVGELWPFLAGMPLIAGLGVALGQLRAARRERAIARTPMVGVTRSEERDR